MGECIGRQKHVAADFLQQFWNELEVQRRGIKEALVPGKQGQQQPTRKTKTMEHRQGVEENPIRIELNMGGDLLDIGDEVGMREHHAARRAETA